ncbi:hypothetical protein CUC53_13100 [Aeromonas cavernicola]|uniref:Uncharacterized protein n=2 Tax=Aeromonas cavernicola TaxID=1006623 RepID=A0A2H9U2X6_9GAMM|nr:hypothetical protein CUC53_13100 [Aeromonas cavernicola]
MQPFYLKTLQLALGMTYQCAYPYQGMAKMLGPFAQVASALLSAHDGMLFFVEYSASYEVYG